MRMRGPFNLAMLTGMLIVAATGCSDGSIVGPDDAEDPAAIAPAFSQVRLAGETADRACWGQASRVFAPLGQMGEHASSFETPRLGLRNLARSLYDMGILADDSMQALGAFVAASLDLSIDACM